MTLTRIAGIAAAAVLSITAFSAVASNYAATIPQEDQARVTESLTAEGYDVKRMEMEDGEIEVYAVKDGVRYELYLDRDYKIIKVEQDD